MEHRFEKPIEKDRSSSYGSNFLVCRSRKLSRRITAFSYIVFDGLLTLEMNPGVSWYCERPLTDEVFIDGSHLTVSPDVFVEYHDGRTEFQWFRYTADECENLSIHVKAWSLQKKENARVLYAKDIYKGPFYIRNLCFLASRARRNTRVEGGFEKAVTFYLKDRERASIADLCREGFLSREHALSLISDFCYRGLISVTDIENKPISIFSEVQLNES